ncbi:MAG: hypothetical protein DMG01_20830 [Acidobacteria bacterium]|nr:MAG: hypothetical protein DMG01_20830 [Acidobacteriota bacterium]
MGTRRARPSAAADCRRSAAPHLVHGGTAPGSRVRRAHAAPPARLHRRRHRGARARHRREHRHLQHRRRRGRGDRGHRRDELSLRRGAGLRGVGRQCRGGARRRWTIRHCRRRDAARSRGARRRRARALADAPRRRRAPHRQLPSARGRVARLSGSRHPHDARDAAAGEVRRSVARHRILRVAARAAPGVEAAAAITMLPFSGSDGRASFLVEGRRAAPPAPVRARPIAVSPDYLQTMRIPLLRGRYLSARDADGTREVVILNESATRRHWPGEDPIGRRISFAQPKPRWLEIVGIVGDVKSKSLDVDSEPEAYLSYWQKAVVESTRGMSVVVRTTAPIDAVAPLLRTAVAELDRDQPIGPIRPLDVPSSRATRRSTFGAA